MEPSPKLECGICLDPADPAAEAVIRIRPCGHVQHKHCQEQWESEEYRAKDCPSCRTPVEDKETVLPPEPEHEDCCVCMEPLAADVIFVHICKHEFHAACLYQWQQQQNTCPFCRADIDRTFARGTDAEAIEAAMAAQQDPDDGASGADGAAHPPGQDAVAPIQAHIVDLAGDRGFRARREHVGQYPHFDEIRPREYFVAVHPEHGRIAGRGEGRDEAALLRLARHDDGRAPFHVLIEAHRLERARGNDGQDDADPDERRPIAGEILRAMIGVGQAFVELNRNNRRRRERNHRQQGNDWVQVGGFPGHHDFGQGHFPLGVNAYHAAFVNRHREQINNAGGQDALQNDCLNAFPHNRWIENDRAAREAIEAFEN